MRVLSFSDIHLDAVTAGKPRRSEVLAFLVTVRAIALREKVDLVIFAGDAHDSGSLLDPMYSSDLISELLQFPRSSEAPVLVAVPGNHDVVDTSELFDGEPITTLTPLRAAARFLPEYEAEHVHILDRPQLRKVADGWAVLALPYLSRVYSLAVQALSWINEAFDDATMHVEDGGRLIVVGHLIIPGATMGSESVEMAKGQDQIFPYEIVSKLKPALVINGHYHARQVVELGGLNVAIPGSPLRFTFGEAAEVSKGVLLMDI